MACALCVVTALVPLLPVNWWWVRIGDFPRLQLAIFYAIGLVSLTPYWRRKSARIGLAAYVVCIGIQAYWIYPYLSVTPNEVEWAQSDDPAARLRIMSANVLESNRRAEALLQLVEQQNPDVLVLLEVNQRWIEDLKPLESRFRFHLTHPLENKYGMALYTNLEVISAEVRAMVLPEIPSIDATLRLRNGTPVRLFAVHPNPPRPGEDTTKRDAELVLVGREVKDDPTVIVLGDLNDVGWSRTTDLFQEVSGLLDPRIGRGMYSTFDAKSWIWRYPLDYCFHSEDFRVAEMKRLPYIGSDHFPLLVELSHEPAARQTQEGQELDQGDREDAQEAVEQLKTEKIEPSPS